MERDYYLNLAQIGLSMPIGADLVLQEFSDAEEILLDGKRLGAVIQQTAERFGTPLAVPHMDLELEKRSMLQAIGIPNEDEARFHFTSIPSEQIARLVIDKLGKSAIPAMQAQADAIKHIAQYTDLLPIGMSIGPFSLMTKLVADPITPVCLAGMGISAADDEEVRLVENVLELGMHVILPNIARQIDAGAKAIFIAEPAANKVFFSPNQIESGSDIFERYVMRFNRRIKEVLDSRGVDLIFHCCGELNDYMVRQFASLDAAILSLGSSRNLQQDAALVPRTTVIYGNLPSKQFYSDELINVEQVVKRGNGLIAQMRKVGHPFILGTECDVLSVPGCHEAILRKAKAVTFCSVDGIDQALDLSSMSLKSDFAGVR